MRNNLVGVIGGLGPMATAKFMEIVINNTEATCDQENVDMLICQYSSIPDRTAYILNDSKTNPVYEMIEAAKLLENNNVLFIVMPCNTATYFYDEVAKSVNIPILNIVKETVNNVIDRGIKKVGLMATDGTIQSGVYDKYAEDKLEIFFSISRDLGQTLCQVILSFNFSSVHPLAFSIPIINITAILDSTLFVASFIFILGYLLFTFKYNPSDNFENNSSPNNLLIVSI